MKTYKLVTVAVAISLACAGAQDSAHIDRSKLTLREREDLVNAVIIDKIEFKHEPLLDCTTRISQLCAKATGFGFDVQLIGPPSANVSITLKAEDIPVLELLKRIADLADDSVRPTPYAFVFEKRDRKAGE